MVIIGAGECGTRAALTLRDEGWSGDVTLIGGESGDPYERPPLSKPAPDAPPRRVPVATAERLADLRIDHRPETIAIALDRTSRTIRLSDGRALPYERLLLATGSRPRRLPAFENTRATTFRDHGDALRLFSRPARPVAIVGAGLIGLELAASLRTRGHAVTVLEASDRALGRAVPSELAERLVARQREAGVDIRFGVAVSSITDEALLLADGASVPADAIVVAIGVTPETALGEASGLTIDNGIAVDHTLRTEDPHVFAAGDCAAAEHPIYGRRLRIETWRNAQDQGIAAARSMLGADAPYARVPWFWSDQYDLGLQAAGLPAPDATTVVREVGPDTSLIFSLAPDGRLIAAAGLGPGNAVARDVRLAEMMIEARARPDPAALADPKTGLKSLLRTRTA